MWFCAGIMFAIEVESPALDPPEPRDDVAAEVVDEEEDELATARGLALGLALGMASLSGLGVAAWWVL